MMSAGDDATSGQGEGRCPRCGEGRLRAWHELSEEEREAARRLPASAHFTLAERMARHRWCARCLHEQSRGEPDQA